MAKEKEKKLKGPREEVRSLTGGKVKDVNLLKFMMRHYKRYGISVLEDRAIPDYRDGMMPVQRRALWAAHTLGLNSKAKYVKAAKVVGEVLGTYHPHGDASAYGSIVNMTNVGVRVCNSTMGFFEGAGNWGSFPARSFAAMRYTECRLSKFSDTVLFNKFYMPVVDKVPNYDSSTTEPVLLPALLPTMLLTAAFGIAPGAQANIPAFTLKSLLALLTAIYGGEKITPKLLASTLRVTTKFGGIEDRKFEDRKLLYKSDAVRGKAVIRSHYEYDERKRTLTYTRFAQGDMAPLLISLPEVKGVKRATDLSDIKDKYGTLEVQIAKGDEEATIKRVEKVMTNTESYVLNFTERYIHESGQAEANLIAMPLVTMLTKWVEWRTDLEVRAAKYWASEAQKEIARLQLLIQAVDLLDFIVALLKDKRLKNNTEVHEAYAKKAKISVEEAQYVLGRPIISLRSLEKSSLLEKVKEQEKEQKRLIKHSKEPVPHMLSQLGEFQTFLPKA